MKTIRSTKLILTSGRSRVYELELTELDRDSDARFVVNYRYGWEGAELQEGTRTPDPVAREAADTIYDSLLLSRQKQGYEEINANAWQAGPSPDAPPQSVGDGIEDPRSARLMHLLGRLHSMTDTAAAKLIWRIGQVKLAPAAELLAGYCRDADQVAARVLPYSLLRCGRERPEAILGALRFLSEAQDRSTATAARIAVSLLSPRDDETVRLRNELPEPVTTALTASNKDEAADQVIDYCSLALVESRRRGKLESGHGDEQRAALVGLYLFSHHNPETRPLFLAVLERIPFQHQLFRSIRQIYKAAEANDDADVFGALSNRIDLERPTIRASYGSYYVRAIGKYVSTDDRYSEDDPSFAWSDRTRDYFRRRVWRHLRRIGQLNDQAYVHLAASCLEHADETLDPAGSDTRWDWNQGRGAQTIVTHFPAMSRRYAVQSILYRAGSRVAASSRNALRWHFVGESVDASVREEPFPHLWDAAPDVALSLLGKAKSEQVQHFAVRILQDNQDYCRNLATSVLIGLLGSTRTAAVGFALEVIRKHLADGRIDGEVVPALFESGNADAVELAQTLLNTMPAIATADPELAAQLIIGVNDQTQNWLVEFWRQHASSTNQLDVVTAVVERARKAVWPAENVSPDKARMRMAAQLLSDSFAEGVQALQLSQLVTLSQSPDAPPTLLAILLAATRPDGLTAFDPASLAQSDDEDLQAAGAELLANTSIEELRKHEALVAAFLVSPVDRAREASRRAATIIAEDDPEAARRLTLHLLPTLYRAEEHEGVRNDLVATMQGPLLLPIIEQGPDLVWKLLRARSEPARRVGAAALESFPSGAFSIRKIARLGTNDQVIARGWALRALDDRMTDVQRQPQDIFTLLDGEWEDSREAAYQLVRERLAAEHWTPEAVVGLCDCITLPAQRFGREVLGNVFSQENSEFFLMRLSEHPAAGFRLTIARLIREYAAGDADRVRKVQHALRTILSRVFSSRSAKEQIYSFIEDEITRGDQEILKTLAGVLDTVSATCAVADKARVLGLIARLKSNSPDLVAHAAIIEPELRQQQSEVA